MAFWPDLDRFQVNDGSIVGLATAQRWIAPSHPISQHGVGLPASFARWLSATILPTGGIQLPRALPVDQVIRLLIAGNDWSVIGIGAALHGA